LYSEALTICVHDYKQTIYYLFCQSPSQVVLVNNVFASFISSDSPRSDCLAQPSHRANTSAQVFNSVCGLCYNTQTCVITKEFIDQKGLFKSDNYQTGIDFYNDPISLTISYQCIGMLAFIYPIYKVS
jgi:hypothetical protein